MYCEEDEFYDEEFYENDGLTDEEIEEIHEEYRRKRLVESLIGPSVSSIFHVLLVVILAIFITDKVKEPIAEIEVTLEEIEEIEIPEKPEPIEIEQPEKTDIVQPDIKVAVDDPKADDLSLEEIDDATPSTDDSQFEDVVSEVVISNSAFASPTLKGGRNAAGRAAALNQFGGSEKGQTKLMNGLWWLAKVQNPDGSWGTTAKSAYTGLALLTFLAHGETTTSKFFGGTVKKAMQWLVNDPIDKKSHHGYPHAIKTYAIAEASAMTGVSMLEEKMNACVKVLIEGQQDGGCYNYNYNRDQGRQDLSFAGWNFQALKAAWGAGCEEPGLNDAIYKAIDWLKKNSRGSAQFPYSTANNTPKTTKSKHTMRGVGVLCLQLFGEGGAQEIRDDLAVMAKDDLARLNWNNPPKESLYGWYYSTQAMFMEGGQNWGPWNRKFQKEIGDAQHKEGYWIYPGEYHGKLGDDITQKVYATTLCCLMLTVWYRNLPSSKHAKGDGNKTVKKMKEKKQVMKEEGLDLITD